MSDFTLTPEQVDIVEAVKTTKDSLILEALAGAAKTSTLVLAAHALPMVPAISVAFNKKIADEMGKRMPGHISSSTMNSLGHRVWGRHVNKRLTVDSGKMYGLLKAEADNFKGEEAKEINEQFASILRALRRAKSAGYIPKQYESLGTPLIDIDTLLDSLASELDLEPNERFVLIFEKVMEMSIAQAYQGLIDFDDQNYMSTLFGGQYPKFPIIMVDEAQDLSPLNHLTLTKMFGGRMIAVGDPYQSIYGFRGADENSMSILQKKFDMKRLTLSVSFRCPKKVVERAQRRVPHMRYPDWAIEGKVEGLREWTQANVPEEAAIICRNNAPLFSCALSLIRSGRGVKMVGAEIGPGLIKLLGKLGPHSMTQEEGFKAVDTWRTLEISKARESRHAIINDRAECLKVFIEQGKTLGAAVAFAEHLFSSAGSIQLMTGHKAKGLEFDTVFHLDPWRIPSKFAKEAAEFGDTSKMEQELNLRYVIETRAKKEMFLVNLEDFS